MFQQQMGLMVDHKSSPYNLEAQMIFNLASP